MSVRIKIGQLALMPGATLDDALDFADELANMMPRASIVVVTAGLKHEVTANTDREAREALDTLDTLSGLWRAGAERMADTRPTIKCKLLGWLT
jgi:hypothetical protein